MKFQPPKGTRDLLPEDARKFHQIMGVVRTTFEKFGFEPLITPAFESFELLSAKGGLGEAVKDEIYYFKDKSARELGLIFDLTMPLARVVASNPQLPKPFKRYQISRVWRYDNPQKLRYREFWQADIDTVGSDSVLADVECLACVCEVLDNLCFKDYYIRVNNRKIMQKVLEKLVSKEKVIAAFRIIDKLDKIGIENVENELKKLGVNAKPLIEILKASKVKVKEYGIEKEIEELEELMEYAKNFGIEKRLKVDFSLVRGLEYYTSVVFEVNLGAKVSCGGGGRYDNLIETVGGVKMPATGISLGLDRIFEVMKEKKMFDTKKSEVSVFIASVTANVKRTTLEIAQKLRKQGINCQTDLMNRNLSKQLEYADNLGIFYVIVVGPEEVKLKKFKLKDMKKKTERELTFENIVKELSSLK